MEYRKGGKDIARGLRMEAMERKAVIKAMIEDMHNGTEEWSEVATVFSVA